MNEQPITVEQAAKIMGRAAKGAIRDGEEAYEEKLAETHPELAALIRSHRLLVEKIRGRIDQRS